MTQAQFPSILFLTRAILCSLREVADKTNRNSKLEFILPDLRKD